MNKWYFAYLHLKKRLEDAEAQPLPKDHDTRMIFGFLDQMLKPMRTKHVHGKFDRSRKSIELALEMYDLMKEHFSGDPEWFPVLLGIESGLLIAKQQLDFIGKEKGG